MFVMAICAGAVATHSLVPPTPGPLGMADNLGLDLGTAIGFGLFLGILPVAATLLIAPRFARGLNVEPAEAPGSSQTTTHADRPGIFASLFPIALPVVLMSGASVAAASGGGVIPGAAWAAVLGHRNAALFLAAFAAAFVLWRTHRPSGPAAPGLLRERHRRGRSPSS